MFRIIRTYLARIDIEALAAAAAAISGLSGAPILHVPVDQESDRRPARAVPDTANSVWACPSRTTPSSAVS